MEAASAGHAKSSVHRSLAALGIQKKDDEVDAQYIARGAFAILDMTKENSDLGSGFKEDVWLDGIYVMVVCNHLSYLLEANFEMASTLALTQVCGIKNSSGIAEVVSSYNAMSRSNSNTILAIGNSCAGWVNSPNIEKATSLGALYKILYQESSKQNS
jgi:hypothetical protein